MVLRELLRHASSNGAKTLIGTFVPTGRNAIVEDHYAKLGFQLVEQRTDGTTIWMLSTEAEVDPPPMQVHRLGFAPLADSRA
jgi:predicted enzyme involved in methoxymalonyl-ACP biosynthesis